MKEFLALFRARNLEFYRDRAALSWAFVFPVLIIIGCTVIFSEPDLTVFKVGLHGDTEQLRQRDALQRPYLQLIDYPDMERAQQRIGHHKLDLLISTTDTPRYWLNPDSGSSRAARDALQPLLENFTATELEGRAVRYVDWVIPGVLAMNMMFAALFGAGYVIVRYRQNGVLKRLQATPLSAFQFLSAQTASRLLIVVGVNALIFVGCDLFLDLLVLGSRWLLLGIALSGAMAMIGLGLVISCRTSSEELAGGLLNVATWPMLFLSEVWFSLDTAPQWVKYISQLMPLTHIVQAGRAVMVEGAGLVEVMPNLVVLLVMTGVFLALAAGLFRWHSGR